MLLMNLKAHTPALTLLANLPFEKSEIKADELEIRAVLRAAYRLLKAMCTDFPLMQTELVASIPLFVDHTEANLVSYDITPTGCDRTRLGRGASCAQLHSSPPAPPSTPSPGASTRASRTTGRCARR